MPRRPALRPENLLVAALVVFGVAVLGALLVMVPGMLRDEGGASRPMGRTAIAILGVGAVAAALILAYGRWLRRRQRPQWLETQGWHQGLVDQVRQGQGARKGGPASGSQPPATPGPGDTGPRDT